MQSLRAGSATLGAIVDVEPDYTARTEVANIIAALNDLT
jgi:hypothetical protein